MTRLANKNWKRRLTLELLERRDVPSFSAPQAFLAGPSPSDVASEDFNGDGLYDLAVTNRATPGKVSVLLNAGDGTFLGANSFPTGGNNPSSLTVRDVSGDGRLDLIVTNAASNTVVVLRGSGTGLFRRPITFAAGPNPGSVKSDDFNNDAIPDVLVANVGSGNTTVLLGQGGGAFQQFVSYDLGTKIKAVSTGDFNSDGDVDIVAVGDHIPAPKTVILLGNGDGTFLFGPQYDEFRPVDVTVGDYNDDGILDLASANQDFQNVTVRLGIGDGTFQPHQSFSVAAAVRVIETADVDGDTNLDLILVGTNANTSMISEQALVILGNGDGSFGPIAPYLAGANSAAVAIRDFTGDGIPDLAIANNVAFNGTVTLQVGEGGGAFNTEPQTFAGSGIAWDMAAADLNGDQDPELTVASHYNSDLSFAKVLLGTDGSSFDEPLSFHLANLPGGFVLADFNDDGDLDLAVSLRQLNPQGIKVALGNGDGTFGPFDFYSIPGGPEDVGVGDFNADGALDLAVPNTGSVSILLGNGDGTFEAPVAFGSGAISREIVVGEFNGDNQLDLAVLNELNNPGTVTILLGNGDGTFGGPTDFAAGPAVHNLLAADFDADSILDLAVVNNTNAGSISILKGRGDGTFMSPVAFTTGPRAASIAAGDINGDGNIDLATGNHSGGTVSVLLGNGDGTFQPSLYYAVDVFTAPSFIDWPAPVAIGDFNQDGWPDIAATLIDSVAILVNDGNWSPLPIGDVPSAADGIAPLDVGQTTETLLPPTAQRQAFNNLAVKPLEQHETAIVLRSKYTSRLIARVALAETTEPAFDLFFSKFHQLI